MRFATAFMLVVIFMFVGCTTGEKKHAAQSQQPTYAKSKQAYQQEMIDQSYDNEESWSSEGYGQSSKKTSAELGERLSTKQIQRALKKTGFYKGEIDGKAGPKTKEAIMKFQKARGLKADGVVGKKTNAELRKYL